MWEGEKEKSGNKKLIIIIVILVLCCFCCSLLGAGAAYVFAGGGSSRGQGPFEPGGIFGGKDLPRCKPLKAKPSPPDPALNFASTTSDKIVQSTHYQASFVLYQPKFALDGDVKTCSHTSETPGENDETPWWRLDMVDQYIIASVFYEGREDCCSNRDNDIQVRVGNYAEGTGKLAPFNRNGLCGEHRGTTTQGQKLTFTCPKMLFGRYLSVQKVKKCEDCNSFVLTICELTIKGRKRVAPPPKAGGKKKLMM